MFQHFQELLQLLVRYQHILLFIEYLPKHGASTLPGDPSMAAKMSSKTSSILW
jgi:hypothetical protein